MTNSACRQVVNRSLLFVVIAFFYIESASACLNSNGLVIDCASSSCDSVLTTAGGLSCLAPIMPSTPTLLPEPTPISIDVPEESVVSDDVPEESIVPIFEPSNDVPVDNQFIEIGDDFPLKHDEFDKYPPGYLPEEDVLPGLPTQNVFLDSVFSNERLLLDILDNAEELQNRKKKFDYILDKKERAKRHIANSDIPELEANKERLKRLQDKAVKLTMEKHPELRDTRFSEKYFQQQMRIALGRISELYKSQEEERKDNLRKIDNIRKTAKSYDDQANKALEELSDTEKTQFNDYQRSEQNAAIEKANADDASLEVQSTKKEVSGSVLLN